MRNDLIIFVEILDVVTYIIDRTYMMGKYGEVTHFLNDTTENILSF